MDPREALKTIKTLANVANESDDIEIVRKHLQMIKDVVAKRSGTRRAAVRMANERLRDFQ